jgi:hypothetical protein
MLRVVSQVFEKVKHPRLIKTRPDKDQADAILA